MDARTLRTLERFLALFLAAGAADALIQFSTGATNYDWRHLAGALVAAAIMAAEQWLKNSGDNAPPSVAGVTAAVMEATGSPLVTVPQPKERIPDPPVVVTLPPEKKPLDTL